MAVSVTTQILITLHLISLHPEGRPFWKKCVSNLGWPLKRTVTSIKTQWCGSICLLPTPTPTHKSGETLIFCLPSHWQLIVKLFLLLALLSPAQESPSLRSYSPFKQGLFKYMIHKNISKCLWVWNWKPWRLFQYRAVPEKTTLTLCQSSQKSLGITKICKSLLVLHLPNIFCLLTHALFSST